MACSVCGEYVDEVVDSYDVVCGKCRKTIRELRDKVDTYEGLLHDIQMYAEVILSEDKVRELIANICRWSYAHRVGNGELSEEEQGELVRRAFEKLRQVNGQGN